MAMPLHDPLHDAEVVEDGEKRGDEDDDGQHLEGEDHAERSGLRCPAWPKTKLAARFGIAQHGVDARADGLKDLAEIGLQHQQREGELQAQAPGDDAQLDGALVGGEQPGDRQDGDQAQEAR